MWIWRRMKRMKWAERIRNEAVLQRMDEERMMVKLIRKRKRNWEQRRYDMIVPSPTSGPGGIREYMLTDWPFASLLPYVLFPNNYQKIAGFRKPSSRIIRTTVGNTVCETWTLTLREEHRLRVFDNKVLRKIFGAKRDEVTGEWKKLRNKEMHALYSSPDIIRNIKSRRLRWAGHVARMGESRNAYRVLVGRSEGKRCRWEDNIKMNLREVGYDDRDWIDLAQDRELWRAYVSAAMKLRVP
ncbi:hypothetical protein ANN_11461 [Periplaneta americana]|uniref:Endonuclease-reverse transcriptase n=1 Tax=Periplaneta americana TaxID=6978 RepID=A0ABQ8T6T5_PERAM|nr:hypothetical protein ANN_11461 [Periplaneta americana]